MTWIYSLWQINGDTRLEIFCCFCFFGFCRRQWLRLYISMKQMHSPIAWIQRWSLFSYFSMRCSLSKWVFWRPCSRTCQPFWAIFITLYNQIIKAVQCNPFAFFYFSASSSTFIVFALLPLHSTVMQSACSCSPSSPAPKFSFALSLLRWVDQAVTKAGPTLMPKWCRI